MKKKSTKKPIKNSKIRKTDSDEYKPSEEEKYSEDEKQSKFTSSLIMSH